MPSMIKESSRSSLECLAAVETPFLKFLSWGENTQLSTRWKCQQDLLFAESWSELNDVWNVKTYNKKKIATSRSTICGKMSAKSYCEGSRNDVVVSGGQHSQPQPLIHVEFIMPPVLNSFSVVGKERKRQRKEVTRAFTCDQTAPLWSNLQWFQTYLQSQTCLWYSVDFLPPLQFWLLESQGLFCSEYFLYTQQTIT